MSSFRRSRIALIATVVAATTVTAACSKRTDGDDSKSSGGSSGRKLSVVVVAGPLADPFFGAMKTGADNAGKDLNVATEYLSPTSTDASGPTLARLMQAAIAKKPDAIVVGNFFPEAQDPEIKSAIKAGIPVVVINSGQTNWKELGAISFVGIEPSLAGTKSGREQAARGVKKGLCVNTVPGNPALEQLCQGYTDAIKKGGGTASSLRVPYQNATNPTKVTQAIAGALRADKSIDGVFTTGAAVAENALTAANNAGRKLTIGSGDLSTQVLKDIKAGKIQYAVDQQPYLQTYYGVLIAKQYVQYRLVPADGVLTGPQVIDKDNAADVLKINEQQKGIRGAS
ncbi:sugar ABC transporter substrate-binding protein [Streptomyces sp. VNUA24]|uniref:sugar ABC transporter substrate-binding protein n=1 Tax=Streptomyces sp. VNUA24 TaxID=3031131 RepID=UPI0023B831B2|nr:sugar ABC transporter substrate-binding protein [Streptomyces sp. VNUA24]WEH19909.1 sugar ABC transporter substrate-binding protein [Streptomyces sp. VNUA24]